MQMQDKMFAVMAWVLLTFTTIMLTFGIVAFIVWLVTYDFSTC